MRAAAPRRGILAALAVVLATNSACASRAHREGRRPSPDDRKGEVTRRRARIDVRHALLRQNDASLSDTEMTCTADRVFDGVDAAGLARLTTSLRSSLRDLGSAESETLALALVRCADLSEVVAREMPGVDIDAGCTERELATLSDTEVAATWSALLTGSAPPAEYSRTLATAFAECPRPSATAPADPAPADPAPADPAPTSTAQTAVTGATGEAPTAGDSTPPPRGPSSPPPTT